MTMMKQPKLSRKQKDFIDNGHSRWNLLTGAVRSGKTYVSILNIPKRVYNLPEGRRALIGKTETTIMRNILDPLQDIIGRRYVSDIYGKKREATIFGKKFYCIGANDARSVKKLQGTGFQYVYGDEITTWPEDFFQMLKSRLDRPGAKFDGTCNPEGPYHWLKKGILDNKDLDVYHQHFTIDDNPFLDPTFVNQLKMEYQGVWYQRYILGRWVLAEGLVYSMFTEDNIVKELPNSFQKYWIGIDYGTANPTSFVLIGLSEDYKIYIIDEWRWGEKDQGYPKTDVQLREDLKKFLERNGLGIKKNRNKTIEWILVDPSAKSFITELYQNRNSFPPFKKVSQANNNVLDGIRLTASIIGNNDLLVNSKLDNVIQEFNTYSWDPKAQERGEDKPLKQYDHSMDGIRYVINSMVMIIDHILRR